MTGLQYLRDMPSLNQAYCVLVALWQLSIEWAVEI